MMNENEVLADAKNNAEKMPCGSNHSCFHCIHYIMSMTRECTWLKRMTEEEFEKHEQSLYARKQ